LKASSATFVRATTAPRPTGPSSARPRPTPTSAEGFALSGPSDLPDPDFHAYRKDLADVALAGQVIASHYAEPIDRVLGSAAPLREAREDNGAAIQDLQPGDPFALLDDSLGWAWGYAGRERRVGYVRSEALAQ
jgi:hypothetical protein